MNTYLASTTPRIAIRRTWKIPIMMVVIAVLVAAALALQGCTLNDPARTTSTIQSAVPPAVNTVVAATTGTPGQTPQERIGVVITGTGETAQKVAPLIPEPYGGLVQLGALIAIAVGSVLTHQKVSKVADQTKVQPAITVPDTSTIITR